MNSSRNGINSTPTLGTRNINEAETLKEIFQEIAANRGISRLDIEKTLEDPDVLLILSGLNYYSNLLSELVERQEKQLSEKIMQELGELLYRPLPARTLLDLSNLAMQQESMTLRSGTLIEKRINNGSLLKFTSYQDITTIPLFVEQTIITDSVIEICVKTGLNSIDLGNGRFNKIRFYLSASDEIRNKFALFTHCYLEKIKISLKADGVINYNLPVKCFAKLYSYELNRLHSYTIPKTVNILSDSFRYVDSNWYYELDIQKLCEQNIIIRKQDCLTIKLEYANLLGIKSGELTISTNVLPVVNLYHAGANPIKTEPGRYEYPLTMAHNPGRRPVIYSIVEITVTDTGHQCSEKFHKNIKDITLKSWQFKNYRCLKKDTINSDYVRIATEALPVNKSIVLLSVDLLACDGLEASGIAAGEQYYLQLADGTLTETKSITRSTDFRHILPNNLELSDLVHYGNGDPFSFDPKEYLCGILRVSMSNMKGTPDERNQYYWQLIEKAAYEKIHLRRKNVSIVGLRLAIWISNLSEKELAEVYVTFSVLASVLIKTTPFDQVFAVTFRNERDETIFSWETQTSD